MRLSTILPEDLGSILSTHMVPGNHVNTSPRVLNDIFWPLWALHAYNAKIYTQAKISVHKIKKYQATNEGRHTDPQLSTGLSPVEESS